MKRYIKISLAIGALLISIQLYSQGPPPPPPPGSGHGQTTNQPPEGGSAPIGRGSVILLLLASVYGAVKISGVRTTKTKLT